MDQIGYEVDYLAVGNGKSGDAIAIRFGNLFASPLQQRVIIIDGGTLDSGAELISLINKHYKTNHVNLVVSTHPDNDHVSGLSVILENMEVDNLLMHRPWLHAEQIKYFFENESVLSKTIWANLRKSLGSAKDLETIALSKKIPIYEPFTGLTAFDGVLHVLGPSKSFYQSLLSNFEGLPNLKITFQKSAFSNGQQARYVNDRMEINILPEEVHTSAVNNSSVVFVLTPLIGHKLLFTGDAGILGLTEAFNYADSQNIGLLDLKLFDVPHHGSKNNVNLHVLNRVFAPTAYVSASRESDDHPADKITNALIKRGMEVYATQGKHLRHHHNAPNREGYGPAQAITFVGRVKE